MKLKKFNYKSNAKWYLSVAIIGSVLIAALIYLCFLMWNNYKNSIVITEENQMLVTVQSMSNSMGNTIESYVSDIKMLAGTAVGEQGDINEKILQSYLESQNFLVNLSVTDSDGKILWEKTSQEFSEKIVAAEMDGVDFSVQSDSSGRLFFLFSSKAQNGDILCSVLDVSKYYDLFSKIRVGSEGYVILKSSSGTILMHPEESQIGIGVISGREKLYPQLDLSSLKAMVERQENGETGIADYYSYWWTEPNLPRVRKIAAFTPVQIGNDFLILSIDMDYNDIYQPIVRGFSGILLVLIGIMAVICAFIVFSFILARKNRKNEEEIQYLKNLNDVLEETHRGEEALAHQQRLQIMGTMTGGIAHEFNNLLTPIMGYADILMGTLPESSDEYDSAKEIFEASEKAKDIVRQISSLSRKNMETVYRFIDADAFLLRAVKMIRTVCPYNITLEMKADLDDVGFFGNQAQMNQVLLNLCVNAIHAIGQRKDGRIDISADTVQKEILADDGVESASDVFSSYIRFKVKDNGCGMDAFTMGQIFTPFFTTKPEGKGTGLGLSVVDQIVHAHKGQITVKSEVGTGTIFTVYIPKSEKMLPGTDETEEKTEKTTRVLLTGMNPKVVNMLKRDFERIGVKARETDQPEEAAEFMNKDVPDILVLEDTSFESGSGAGTSEMSMKIRERYPSVIQIIVADQIRKEIVEARQQGIIDAYILKPVSVSAIIEAAGKSAKEKSVS